MGGIDIRLTGVVCDHRPSVRRSIAGLLVGCGFTVVGEVEALADLRALISQAPPLVAVLTMPVTGMSGLNAMTELRAASPDCELVVVSAFGNLELAAREAGAYALVAEDDPVALRTLLLRLAQQGRAAASPQPAIPAARESGTVRESGSPSVVI